MDGHKGLRVGQEDNNIYMRDMISRRMQQENTNYIIVFDKATRWARHSTEDEYGLKSTSAV